MHKVYRIDLEDALVVLRAAEEEAERIGVKETVCIADDGGHIVALHRMTGARLTGVEIATAKAFTSAGHQRATHLFNEPPNGPALPGNEAFGINQMIPGRFAIFVGGFPLVHDGQVVAAIGVSGGNGTQDKAVGAAAIAAFERLMADGDGDVGGNGRTAAGSRAG
ncbi:heme-binding protein [Acidiferrimicrobium sp. IK]|uniref:GlcG/HbpS family heme-binding protein n=1 Tax=Acidiferrimicrobium sp. IK TaxID=2871700 RepID=UPI0021CB9912|nr:heme-binding protein [Acidiferrimicrobium sp. IK]MCU4187243.1 heme-binding protein [Acidiferrimicrobium sp. IK]